MRRLIRFKPELKAIDEQSNLLPKPSSSIRARASFTRAGTFRPALQPRPVYVLTRGSVQSPAQARDAGALTVCPGSDAQFTPAIRDEGARRAALANWIADPNNMLTWRSIVNRVWQYHFGAGLVDTPSDFGRMGSKPSHPELLDWLAVWFRDEAQGSLKACIG